MVNKHAFNVGLPDNLGTNYSFNGQDMYLFAKLTFLKEFKRRHVYAQGD